MFYNNARHLGTEGGTSEQITWTIFGNYNCSAIR
jgi:hypothetical protein